MKTELRLVPTEGRELGGLIKFNLNLYENGAIVKTWVVNSGQPAQQRLLHYLHPDSRSGDSRPIPEAIYSIGNLEFSEGRFDWASSWGPGLGNYWSDIIRVDSNLKIADFVRKAFGFHWDENRASSPGSLGCVVFATKADVESFVQAMRKYDPQYLIVDYGFNTVPEAPKPAGAKPEVKPPEKKKVLEAAIIANQNGATLRVYQDIKAGDYNLFTLAEGWTIRLTEKG